MQHRLPPAPMTATKTPAHLLASDAETTPNQRSEQEDQPACRQYQGIEDTERQSTQAHAQQPSAGSLTSSNSSSSGGSSSDGDDADETILQQEQPRALSRSSLMARRWGQASSALSEKAATDAEEQGDSPSKPRPQAIYVMNKARDLCARIRHQAKVKQREERKRILLQRQVARDLARQEAREAALRREEEATKAARRELEREHLQALESQADTFHALQLARVVLRQLQASVEQAKALRQDQRQEQEERLHQAAKMERLREGVLLWDRWAKQRAVFIWYVKAQHMSKLEQQQQQQRFEEEEKARVAAAAAAAAAFAVLAPYFSSFAGWALQAGKWVKWQVDRACAPPRRPKSPSFYMDEC